MFINNMHQSLYEKFSSPSLNYLIFLNVHFCLYGKSSKLIFRTFLSLNIIFSGKKKRKYAWLGGGGGGCGGEDFFPF
jgi:hypothetical protein